MRGSNPDPQRRSRRDAWSAALGGLTVFTIASLIPGTSQSPLLRILAFAVGTISGVVLANRRSTPRVNGGSR